MSDFEQITAHLARYCHIVDNDDAETIAGLFWYDATLVLNGEHTGRAAIVTAYQDWIGWRREPVEQLRHMIFAPAIELDGDRASVRTYFNADCFSRKSKRAILIRGIYRDEMAKRGGEWRFLRREIDVYPDPA